MSQFFRNRCGIFQIQEQDDPPLFSWLEVTANDDIKEENMRLKYPNLSYLEILEKLAEEE